MRVHSDLFLISIPVLLILVIACDTKALPSKDLSTGMVSLRRSSHEKFLQTYNKYVSYFAIASAFRGPEKQEGDRNDKVIAGTFAARGEFPYVVRPLKCWCVVVSG